MKIISVAAVTAGGKTTIVNELKKRLRNSQSLHFDNYTFEGEVDNFFNGYSMEQIIMFGI